MKLVYNREPARDVLVLPDGSLLVSDDSAHVIHRRVTPTIPLSTPRGRYFACADDLNQVAETNDLNNCRVSPPLKIR